MIMEFFKILVIMYKDNMMLLGIKFCVILWFYFFILYEMLDVMLFIF